MDSDDERWEKSMKVLMAKEGWRFQRKPVDVGELRDHFRDCGVRKESLFENYLYEQNARLLLGNRQMKYNYLKLYDLADEYDLFYDENGRLRNVDDDVFENENEAEQNSTRTIRRTMILSFTRSDPPLGDQVELNIRSSESREPTPLTHENNPTDTRRIRNESNKRKRSQGTSVLPAIPSQPVVENPGLRQRRVKRPADVNPKPAVTKKERRKIAPLPSTSQRSHLLASGDEQPAKKTRSRKVKPVTESSDTVIAKKPRGRPRPAVDPIPVETAKPKRPRRRQGEAMATSIPQVSRQEEAMDENQPNDSAGGDQQSSHYNLRKRTKVNYKC